MHLETEREQTAFVAGFFVGVAAVVGAIVAFIAAFTGFAPGA